MKEHRLLIQLIGKDYLFKLIFALLLYSLVPLAEIFFFIYLGNLIGNWLVIVLAALAGLPGVLIAHSQLQDVLRRLRARLGDGSYPGLEIADLLGILVGGVFLLTPGFLTDVAGYALMVPFLRERLARALARKMDRGMRDLYHSLRLREL